MRYANFKETGEFLNLLIKGMHVIPENAVEITEYQAITLLNERDGIWKLIGGEIVKTPLPQPSLPSLDQLKAAKLAEINQAAQAEVQVHLQGYPDFEIQTWYIQQGEAVAFSNDPTAPTPFCDTAALARGISKEDFIAKVLVKVEQFKQLSAIVAGYRQSLEDKLNAIKTDTNTNRKKVQNLAWVSPLQV